MSVFNTRCKGMVIFVFCLLLSSCSSLMSSAGTKFAGNLSFAILNHNDSETVKQAAPAYLLMTDGLLRDNPDNISLLQSAAMLYTAYTDVYVKDKARARKLSDRGLDYALKAICLQQASFCSLKDKKYEEFEKTISSSTVNDVPALYTLGVSWAGWIKAHQDDWNAVADISKVEAVMRQVVKLDEKYQEGSAHLYLGILSTLLPPALGGKPEDGRVHFEKAISLSGGKNLAAKVAFARQYARLIFDRDLHDRLLKEVLDAKPDQPGYTLMNTLAQKEAEELLQSADGYF